MKKTIFLPIALLFAVNLAAQNMIIVEKLNPFGQLQVNGKIELFLTIDPAQPLTMNIDLNGNDVNHLNWWDADGVLQIKYSPRSKAEPVIIRLNCHSLESMDIERASVTVESPWTEFMTTLNLSSGARLTAEIHSKDIKATTQTSSALVLKGSADFADFDARSKSTLNAREFEAGSATLRGGGYSESYVYGRDRLIIDAVDGAAVFFRGKPEIMRQRTTRAGHINSIGE